jgi:hypothetical protein
MLNKVALLFVVLLFSGWARGVPSGTAFTSNCAGSTCNWNSGASWAGGTGSNWPRFSSDTATISANDQVAIPSGVTVNIGSITFTAGTSGTTTVTINGTLSLFGPMTLAASTALGGGPGGIFDLRGNNVTSPSSGTIQYNLAGNVGSHFVLRSTGAVGKLIYNFSSAVVSTWSYVDVTGLGDSVFGRGQSTAGSFQSYSHVTFTNCGAVSLEDTAVGANSGILVSHVDFRNPSAANPSTANSYQPRINFGSTVLGSQQRTIEYTTWSEISPTTTNYGVMQITAHGLTLNNSVIADYQTYIAYADNTFENSFQIMNAQPRFAVTGETPQILTSDYFYNNITVGGGHAFDTSNSTLVVTNSVFEGAEPVTDTTYKWFLDGGVGNSGNWTIHGNIFIGFGVAIDFYTSAGGSQSPTVLFYNNTSFIDNKNQVESTPVAVGMRVDHPGTYLNGSTVQFYNNIIDKPNTATAQDVFISLTTTDANQVTYANYNAGWEEPSTSPSTPVLYSTGPSPPTYSITVTGGYAANDFAANPQFIDNTRKLAVWDTSLGGPGTVAHAVAQMLQLNGYGGTFNSSYTEANLLSYVRAGFVPGNSAAFKGTGRSGADVGALAVP